jgi:protein subunit release factor B
VLCGYTPALVADKKTREQGVHLLVRAERLAPQRIRHDVFVREAVAPLLRQARYDAGAGELRGLARCLGITSIG